MLPIVKTINMNIIIKDEQKAYSYCEDTIKLKQQLELGWLELCKRLYIIKEKQLSDISQYGDFYLFLDEIKIKPNTAIHMIAVYRRLCVELGVSEDLVMRAGGYTVAYVLLPMCTDTETAQNALLHAERLPNRESVKDMVKEALSGSFKPICPCDDCFVVKVCKACKSKQIIHADETGA